MFYRYEHYMSISHIALIVNMVHMEREIDSGWSNPSRAKNHRRHLPGRLSPLKFPYGNDATQPHTYGKVQVATDFLNHIWFLGFHGISTFVGYFNAKSIFM